MKYTRVIASGILVSTAFAAYVPSEPWSTLTPTASAPSGATTDYSNKFGIQIKTLSSASATSAASNEKRDAVNQIEDGQIQKQNSTISTPAKVTSAATVINQIDDGQIQHQTASVINQIDDGQIQHQTASVINQIDDGQIQHQTASVINQIDDGQIQHQTAATTASAINQIDDGQIQHQTATASGIDQITDGQIQHQTATAASQISDGQVQNPTATASSDDKEDSGDLPEACIGKTSLSMTLKDSILTDANGRVGAIVANRQFQFDGPPPQAGSIYAAGWSITSDGLLALGDQTTFYQCKSGDFYNLYDENTAEQCSAVELEVIKFVDC